MMAEAKLPGQHPVAQTFMVVAIAYVVMGRLKLEQVSMHLEGAMVDQEAHQRSQASQEGRQDHLLGNTRQAKCEDQAIVAFLPPQLRRLSYLVAVHLRRPASFLSTHTTPIPHHQQ